MTGTGGAGGGPERAEPSFPMPPPLPPDDPEAWYAPDVQEQHEVHPGVVVTIRRRGEEFAYRIREPSLTAVDADRLEATVAAVERGALPAGTARTLVFNDSRAAAWASANCPSGPDRQFGACEAIDGVVVQNRTGRTYVLAVAVDVRVTGPDGTLRVRTVLGLDRR